MKRGYIIIDKNINNYKTGKNKNLDIYLYAYIKLCSDFKTGISHATEKKIHELTGIALRTMQSAISRLRKTDLIYIETKHDGEKRHNTYFFNKKPENFFYVDNSLFHVDMDVKLKGLLLLVKSLCINNTNTTLYNKTTIAKTIGQDRTNVSKMINELIEKDMLIEINGAFVLPANYFPFYSKEKQSKYNYEKFNRYDEFVLNSILEICRDKNTVLFVSNLEPLEWIFACFPILEKDVENLDNEKKMVCYLPEVLKSRCSTLPHKIESLNYFLEVLNIKKPEQTKTNNTIIL